MRLIVEYPIVLEKAVPPRSTFGRTVIAKDVTTVEIPEYSVSEAPAVMRELSRAPGNTDGPLDRVRNYRLIGDNLYVRTNDPHIEKSLVRYEFGFRKGAMLTPAFHDEAHRKAVEAVSRICKSGKSFAKVNAYPEDVFRAWEWGNKHTSSRGPAPHVELPYLHSMRNFVSYDHDAVEIARTEYRSSIEGVVLIDGKFMRRCREPIYVVNVDEDAEEPSVRILHGINTDDVHKRSELHPWQGYFAADDFDGAMEYAAEMWRLRVGDDKDYTPIFENAAPIEILDGSFVRFDGDATAAAIAAETMRGNFVKPLMTARAVGGASGSDLLSRHLNEIGIDSFTAFRSLTAALSQFENAQGADDVVTAARECLDSPDCHIFCEARDLPLIELALGRWGKRHMRQELGLVF